MKTKMHKLLSLLLVMALALSLVIAAVANEPAQALTASEITSAQTAAAKELADAQARADKAWNALQSLPTPEEVKAGTKSLPTTCPYCGKTSVSWYIVTGNETEALTNAGTKHVYLAADATFNGTANNAFINASSTNTCVFTNGYDITSTKLPAIFVSNSVNNIIAWSRTSRTEGSSLIRGYKTGNTSGSTVFSNGGTAKGTIHMFGGTYKKYDPNNETASSVMSDHGNSGKYHMYEGTTIEAGTKGSAVNLSGTMTHNPITFTMYGGTITGGANRAAVSVGASSDKNASHYCKFTMYGGTINGGAGQAALESVSGANGKDCLITVYGGAINGNTADSSYAVKLSTAKTDFKMYGGTINGKSGNVGGPAIYTEVASKITIAGGNVNGTTTSGTGGTIYIKAAATLNINGGTISGGNAPSAGNIYLNGGAIVTMTGGIIENGVARGNAENKSYGGNMYVYNSTFTLENGIIRGGSSAGSAEGRGGNLYITTGSAVEMNGGTVSDGYAREGGNIYVYSNATASFTMNGGLVDGGESIISGGNILKGTNAIMTLNAGAVIQNGIAGRYGGNISIDGGTLTTSAEILNGTGRLGGGNINGAAGHVIVNGGTIANGWVSGAWDKDQQKYVANGGNWGGNIRCWNGQLTINHGVIYGGHRGVGNDAASTNNADADNIGFKRDGSKTYTLAISGGTIVGDVGISNDPTVIVKLSGAPQVLKTYTYFDEETNQNVTVSANANGLYLQEKDQVDISELSEGAMICVSGAENAVLTEPCDNVNNLKKCFISYTKGRCVTVNSSNSLVYSSKHGTKKTITAAAATCEAGGYAVNALYCATCNEYYNSAYTARLEESDVVIAALGHNPISHDAKAPTCTEIGWNAYETCARCDYTTYVEQSALGHKYTGVETTAPTCEGKGVMTYTCANDVSHTYTEEIAALGHDYKSVVTDATCTTDGKTVYTCANCGDSYEEVIPAGHKIQYVAAVVPANCQETGHDEYWFCSACNACFGDEVGSYQINPAWINYTGEHVRPEGAVICAVVPCELCGEDSYGEACDRGDAPQCQDAPCVNCGEMVYGWGCNYNTGDEEIQKPLCQPGECVYCGTHYEKLYDCENGSWAPCTYDGECAYGCGKQYPATGEHELDDPCAGGMCWLCWEEIEGAHTEVIDQAKAPTCTATGLTEGAHCGLCGETIIAQDEVPALGHKYTNYIYNNDATYEADGTETATCDNGCGATDTRIAEGTKLLGAAQIGDTAYNTLQEALAAAKAGETVKLLSNVDASSEVVLLMNGVKLDLGGKELKVNYLIATTGGSEVLDADGTGIVIMAKKNLTMINPDCLPVWCEDEGGYRFSKVNARIYEQSKSADSLTLWYWFADCALDAALKSELENVSENGIKVVLRVEYTTADGSVAKLSIVVPENLVVTYAQNGNAPHFSTTIRGLNALGNAKITVVATYGDIEITGATYSYEAV